jgi:hypothetical protein
LPVMNTRPIIDSPIKGTVLARIFSRNITQAITPKIGNDDTNDTVANFVCVTARVKSPTPTTYKNIARTTYTNQSRRV